MGYKSAEQILPRHLIEQIQQYIDGEYLYIPRHSENKREWGSSTGIKRELKERNRSIYEEYRKGWKISQLAARYYLSEKSIERILLQKKREYK